MEDINNKDLTEYINYLRVNRNYSDYTLLNYENDIKEFFLFLNSEGLDYLDITYQDLRGLLEDYKNKKYKSTSIRRKISAARLYSVIRSHVCRSCIDVSIIAG